MATTTTNGGPYDPNYYQMRMNALYWTARQYVHAAVRTWYVNDMVIEMPERGQGNQVARMSSWLGTATRLANALADLENRSQFFYGGVVSYDELLPTARQYIHQAVEEMWASARRVTMPLGPKLSKAEEFSQYRHGALDLATQLAPLYQEAIDLQMRAQMTFIRYSGPEHGGQSSDMSLPNASYPRIAAPNSKSSDPDGGPSSGDR